MELPPDSYTQWDRLPIVYPRLHEGVRGGGAVDCHLRCVARIEPYELAARAAKDHGSKHAAGHRAIAGLSDDYRARCATWSMSEAAPQRHTVGQSLLIAACGLVGPLSLWAVVSSDPRLASLRWWPAALMAAPLAMPMALTALSAAARTARPRVNLGQAICERRCPDCACPLADAVPAITPTLIEGEDVGPRACPRCRRPWPLLPPPPDAAVIADSRTGRVRTVPA